NASDTGYLGFNGTGETAFVVTETGDSAGLGDTLLSCGTGVAGDAITTFTCDLPEGDDIPVSVITSTDLAVEDGSF
ncbi:MAG TPA: hypothetical protein VEJ84_05260, partial [Acidimicrobiales bacterium]|nr:hypothetical protein [Acidimicrobiales bacterium]